jgi:hypothetical protein
VSTHVRLQVLPGPDVDVAAVCAFIASAGGPDGHGTVRRGDGPTWLTFQVSGPDRVALGRELEQQLLASPLEVAVELLFCR